MSHLSRLSMAAFVFSADCGKRPPHNLPGIVLQYFTSRLDNPRRPRPPHCWGFEITLCTNPLDEWSARRRDLFLKTHNAHQWQTCMPPAGFETPSPSKRAAIDLSSYMPRPPGSALQYWHLSYAYMSQESRYDPSKKLHLQIRKPNGK
jgi:hypothetical protein